MEFLTDKEIGQFLDGLDHHGDGTIDYRELELKLDEAHNELAQHTQTNNPNHGSEEEQNRHRFLRSIVCTDKNRIPRAELAQRIQDWQIPSLEHSKKEEQDDKDYVHSMSMWRRVRAYWAVHGPEILFIALVVGMQLAFGVWQLVKYIIHPEYRQAFGWGVVVAKACAGALCPTFFFLILSMSRYFSTFLRKSYYLSRFVNWDLSQLFHIKIACVALALATLHAIGHLTGTFVYGTQPKRQKHVGDIIGHGAMGMPYSAYVASLPGWSGVAALALFWTMALCGMPAIRRRHYELFQLSHLLMYPLIGLLMAHGTSCLLQYPMLGYFLAFPTLLIFVERLTRVVVGFHRIPATLKILDGEAVEIKAKVPNQRLWEYRAGQYVFLQVPALSYWQWHPFTISTCIGREFQLNIKTDGNWTNQLRDLANGSGGKAAQIEIGVNGPFGAPAQRFYDFSHTIVVGAGIGVTSFSGILADLQARNDRRHSLTSTDEGDTNNEKPPLRNSSSDSSLTSLSSASTPSPSPSPQPAVTAEKNKNENKNKPKQKNKPTATTPSSHSSSPFASTYRRCDFHWMVRDRNYLLWFSDLLNSTSRSQARYQRARRASCLPSALDIRINTHVTQGRARDLAVHIYRWLLEKQRSPSGAHRPSVSPLTGLVSPTRFGRPDFVAILEEHYEDMKRYRMSLAEREIEEEELQSEGKRKRKRCCAGGASSKLKVGVFFCGAPVVGEILADRCRALTARGRADGSRVEYHFITEVFG